MSFMKGVYDKVKGRGMRVVYPEGAEERAIRAAGCRRGVEIVTPVVIGAEGAVREKARALGVGLDGVVVRDPASDGRRADFEAEYLELRKHKGMTAEKAKER